MEKCTIYYDDSLSSREFTDMLAKYEHITCKQADEFTDYLPVYEENKKVGFIFESNKEKLPSTIKHIIGSIVMDKAGECFLFAAGGERELMALRSASADLERRGYQVVNLYSKYLFERFHMNKEEGAERIVSDLESGEESYPGFRKRISDMPRREMRKTIYREYRNYRKYCKGKHNKRRQDETEK